MNRAPEGSPRQGQAREQDTAEMSTGVEETRTPRRDATDTAVDTPATEQERHESPVAAMSSTERPAPAPYEPPVAPAEPAAPAPAQHTSTEAKNE
jgi:hypothetical protein